VGGGERLGALQPEHAANGVATAFGGYRSGDEARLACVPRRPADDEGSGMNEPPRQESPEMEAVKEEIREEHGDAANAPSAAPQKQEQVGPEEFENDPARNPDNEALKNVKGA
jgi:hypothetical protein